LSEYHGEPLYPSGAVTTAMGIKPWYMRGMQVDYPAVAAKNREAADAYMAEFERFHFPDSLYFLYYIVRPFYKLWRCTPFYKGIYK
jgi:hypothetical protein